MSKAQLMMSDSPVGDNKGSHPVKKCIFFNIVQKAFGPPPHSFEHYVVNFSERILTKVRKGKVHKKSKKKLTSVSFMYVCVAENVELLVFFLLFFAPSP